MKVKAIQKRNYIPVLLMVGFQILLPMAVTPASAASRNKERQVIIHVPAPGPA